MNRRIRGGSALLGKVAANEIGHRWPRGLPDGRTLLYYVQGEQPGVYSTTLDRPDLTHRVIDASLDAAFVPARGQEAAQVVRVHGDAVVVQPFSVASMQLVGPSTAFLGAGNAATNSGANRSNLSVADDGTILYTSGSSRKQLYVVQR